MEAIKKNVFLWFSKYISYSSTFLVWPVPEWVHVHILSRSAQFYHQWQANGTLHLSLELRLTIFCFLWVAKHRSEIELTSGHWWLFLSVQNKWNVGSGSSGAASCWLDAPIVVPPPRTNLTIPSGPLEGAREQAFILCCSWGERTN